MRRLASPVQLSRCPISFGIQRVFPPAPHPPVSSRHLLPGPISPHTPNRRRYVTCLNEPLTVRTCGAMGPGDKHRDDTEVQAPGHAHAPPPASNVRSVLIERTASTSSRRPKTLPSP